VNQAERGYWIPAALVSKLIIAIITAIIAIGGYMVIWALNDAQWKATWQRQIEVNSGRIAHIEQQQEEERRGFKRPAD
jgi:uncharacterized membrane protein